MSFLAQLVPPLVADLAAVLKLDPAAVYLGRSPQKVQRQGLEVWIRPVGVEPAPHARLHTLEVHLRLRARREGNLSGALQLGAVLDGLDLLRDRYDGQRPFAAKAPTLVALEAETAELDHDPDDPDVLDGTLRLKALEQLP